MRRSILLAALLTATPALATDIFSLRTSGSWSDPTLWPGGVIPGAGDTGWVGNVGTIVFDLAAPPVIGGVEGNSHTYTFEKPMTFGGFGLRESTFDDSGYDIVFTDVFGNGGHAGGGSFNGGVLVRHGGVFTMGRLDLGRVANDWGFRPGDVVQGGYTTTRLFNRWPSFYVTQDPVYYGANLGEGLSFDSATATINLGYNAPGDLSTITLNWDAGMTGPIDWTFRWAGDHAAEIQNWYALGHLIIGTTPMGRSFNPATDIFFDAATGYTYVGFASTDGNGVCEVTDGEDNDGDGYVDDCLPIGFSSLLPGRAGRTNGLVLWDLVATRRWTLLVSTTPGSTPLPGCPGLFADLGSPRVVLSGLAPATGVVAQTLLVPGAYAGRTATLQVIESGTCRTSDPFTITF